MDTCQDCGARAIWDVVVTIETEHTRPCGRPRTERFLCGPCYDAAAATLRAFSVPFDSRMC